MIHDITTPIEFSIEIESLYIARVFQNISKKRIATLFESLSLAKIKGIDLVTKIGKDGKPYNSAYIHVDSWFDTTSAKHFQEKIRSDAKEALLVYDDPWYWIVNENISPEKSRFIQKAEEEDQRQSVDTLTEMRMMLDNLEKLLEKNKKEFTIISEEYEKTQKDYEEEEYQILKEQRFQEREEKYELEVQEYLEQQNKYLYYGKG